MAGCAHGKMLGVKKASPGSVPGNAQVLQRFAPVDDQAKFSFCLKSKVVSMVCPGCNSGNSRAWPWHGTVVAAVRF
jgi:hypothetical protein